MGCTGNRYERQPIASLLHFTWPPPPPQSHFLLLLSSTGRRFILYSAVTPHRYSIPSDWPPTRWSTWTRSLSAAGRGFIKCAKITNQCWWITVFLTAAFLIAWGVVLHPHKRHVIKARNFIKLIWIMCDARRVVVAGQQAIWEWIRVSRRGHQTTECNDIWKKSKGGIFDFHLQNPAVTLMMLVGWWWVMSNMIVFPTNFILWKPPYQITSVLGTLNRINIWSVNWRCRAKLPIN